MILHLGTKFQCHTFFPSQDIKQNVLSSYLGNWWRHKLLRFIFDHPLKQWPTGRKRGKDGKRKIWYLENEKSFFDEIKSIFHSFWRVIIWWKNKNLIKIADTSFNFEYISHLFSTVSIVDFKQVNVSWEHYFFCCRPWPTYHQQKE